MDKQKIKLQEEYDTLLFNIGLQIKARAKAHGDAEKQRDINATLDGLYKAQDRLLKQLNK